MSYFSHLTEPVSEKELKRLRNQFKKSLKQAKQLAKLHPKYPESEFMEVHLHHMTHNAVSQRDEALLDQLHAEHEAIKPGDEAFQHLVDFNRANLRIAQHRFEEALELFNKLEATGKRSYRTQILNSLIELNKHLGDNKTAAKWVHEFLAFWNIDNAGHGTYANYGGLGHMLSILAEAGEYESVIKYGLERIKYGYPKEQYLHFLVGQSYLYLKDVNNAKKYFSYIFKRSKPYPEAYVNLGDFYFNEEKDLETAIKYLIKSIKACGTDPDYKPLLTNVYKNIGLLCKWLEDAEKASKYRRQMFEAMGHPVLLSDLVSLFTNDRGSMEEYRKWIGAES